MSFSTSYVPLLGSDFRVLCPFSLNLLTSVKLTALAPRWRRRRIAARAEQQREASPQTFRATTLGSVLPTRAAGPLRGQRPCGCCPSTRHGRAAAGRAAVGEQLPGGSPRRAFAPREAEVCVGPLLALAWPLQMDIAALESTRRSTAREQLFSVLCDCRLQRALGLAGGGSAGDARGTCSSSAQCRCPTSRRSSGCSPSCACLRRTTPPTT